MTFSAFDTACMSRALQLARQGWYTTQPNPRVGCVIARDGRVVGEGFHRRAGEPHAEINALAAAGEGARGGVVYVTLEPCNHRGRTGPCSQALIAAGVAEVVYAMADPHRVASGGIGALEQAGIRVRGPLLEAQAAALNPGFVKRCHLGLPRVTVKLAMSLDGRTAMASGESQWITGAAARRDVQLLRAASSAIITGSGTVLADNPALTVRAAELPLANAAAVAARQPLRVIVDSGLRTPVDARLVTEGGEVLIATAVAADNLRSDYPPRVSQLSLAGDGGKVDLRGLLAELARRECNEVLVEAGPQLAGAMLAAGLVDLLVVYMAAKLMGSKGRPLLELPLDTMAQSLPLRIDDIRALGGDWRISAIPENS